MAAGRCRLHGLSTGPRTQEGLQRIIRAPAVHGAYSAEMWDLRRLMRAEQPVPVTGVYVKKLAPDWHAASEIRGIGWGGAARRRPSEWGHDLTDRKRPCNSEL
jgi:hypothetical protein